MTSAQPKSKEKWSMKMINSLKNNYISHPERMRLRDKIEPSRYEPSAGRVDENEIITTDDW